MDYSVELVQSINKWRLAWLKTFFFMIHPLNDPPPPFGKRVGSKAKCWRQCGGTVMAEMSRVSAFMPKAISRRLDGTLQPLTSRYQSAKVSQSVARSSIVRKTKNSKRGYLKSYRSLGCVKKKTHRHSFVQTNKQTTTANSKRRMLYTPLNSK